MKVEWEEDHQSKASEITSQLYNVKFDFNIDLIN